MHRPTITKIFLNTLYILFNIEHKNIISLCDINEYSTYTLTHKTTFYKTHRNDQNASLSLYSI